MFIQRLRRGLVAVGLVLFATSLGAQDATPGAQPTVVVLLRHGERQSLFDSDSPLSEAGLRRARALVPLLAGFQPVALYTSDLRRTQQTMGPTALQLGLTSFVRPKDGSGALAAELLRDQRGKTVLVCWHHDLMKKIVRGLGVKGPIPYWSIDTYDRLWILRVPATGEATLEERVQASVESSEIRK